MRKRTGQPDVSIITKADIAFALRMTDIERWGYLRRDFENLIAFEPAGCFIAREGGRAVGMVTSTSYGSYAFVGTLIVERARRNTGIGRSLLEHAMGYLRGKGVRTIELDGVFQATSLYRRLGFKDKYLSLRFLRPPTEATPGAKPPGPEPSGEVAEFDLRRTGIERGRIIRSYLEQLGDSLFTLGGGALRAYAFVRPRAGGAMGVGPFVADDDRAADLLMSSLVKRYSDAVLSIGIPEDKRSLARLLTDLGFQYNVPSLRMYWGDRKDYETHIYGILSPEKG
jgi:GNAT superfamily N-acetyltransferase